MLFSTKKVLNYVFIEFYLSHLAIRSKTMNYTVQADAAYFNRRLSEIGLTISNAAKHGLSEDADGNILQAFRSFRGEQIEFVPQFGTEANQRKKTTDRKTQTTLADFSRPLVLTRHTPEQIATGKPKYKFPSKEYTGFSPLPMPTNSAINAFNKGITGGTVLGIEGYFKAIALANCGVESFAFSGITTYRLDDILREYLIERQPEKFIIAYDGDALDLKEKDGIIQSRRRFDFYNSARRFASQFLTFCKGNGIKTKLYFAAIKQSAGAKGADDVLNLPTTNRDKFAEDLNECNSNSTYFDFIRLSKTNHEKQLKEYFSLVNYRTFYESAATQIKSKPFKFKGAKYELSRTAGDLFTKPNEVDLRLLDRPFETETIPQKIVVKKYISDAQKQLDEVLNTCNRIAFEAPTGSGKTTFFIQLAKRSKTRIVIAVPYISQAKQLGNEYRDIKTLHGKVSNKQLQAALNSDAVVCTYDNLNKLRDIDSRICVIDEAHNLINQFGEVRNRIKLFRADTLRNMLKLTETAKKVVLISGTMPRLLCDVLGFKLVNIEQNVKQQINIHPIEVMPGIKLGMQSTLLAELQTEDFEDGNIRFAIWNNRERLTQIKNELVKTGLLKAEEIEVITRADINSGTKRIYNQITAKGNKISGIKLVLCTCLIAEGVNIKNTNIGNVFAVNVKDTDLLRQFVARFRKLDTVEVKMILPTEKDLKIDFFLPAVLQVKVSRNTAELQKELYGYSSNQHFEDYEDNDLEFYDDIKPDYDYLSREFDKIYIDENRKSQTDILRILADIKQRETHSGNNCYLLSKLDALDNFHIISNSDTAAEDIVEDAAKLLEESAEVEKERKNAILGRLKGDLKKDASTVVKAYQMETERTKNHHAANFLNVTVTDLIEVATDANALKYLTDNADIFQDKKCKNLIRAYCKMYFVGTETPLIFDEIDNYRESNFNKAWNAIRTGIELKMYDDWRERRLFTVMHKMDLKAKKSTISKITKALIGKDKLTLDEITIIIQSIYSRKRYNKSFEVDVIERAATISRTRAKAIFFELFTANECKKNTFSDVKLHFDNSEKHHSNSVMFLKDLDFKDNPNLLKIIELRKSKK